MDCSRLVIWVGLTAMCSTGCVTREPLGEDGGGGDGMQTGDGDGDADGSDANTTATGDGDGDGDSGGVSPFGDVGDRYLVAVDTSILPGSPLQFEATVTAASAEEVTVAFVPLSLELNSTTEPRERIEADRVQVTFDVPASGEIEVDLGERMISGAANPITGSDIVASLVLQPSTDAAGLCGTADGEVTKPIQQGLAGSTFSAIPIAPNQDWPDDFPCVGSGSDRTCFTDCETLGDYTP